MHYICTSRSHSHTPVSIIYGTRGCKHPSLRLKNVFKCGGGVLEECSPQTRMAPIRNAEKKRISTCSFADKIAAASIKIFRSHPESQNLVGHQTVLAAIALVDEEQELQVRKYITIWTLNFY
jgi:hypothetical protein